MLHSACWPEVGGSVVAVVEVAGVVVVGGVAVVGGVVVVVVERVVVDVTGFVVVVVIVVVVAETHEAPRSTSSPSRSTHTSTNVTFSSRVMMVSPCPIVISSHGSSWLIRMWLMPTWWSPIKTVAWPGSHVSVNCWCSSGSSATAFAPITAIVVATHMSRSRFIVGENTEKIQETPSHPYKPSIYSWL